MSALVGTWAQQAQWAPLVPMTVLAFNYSPTPRQLQFSPEEVLGMVLNYSRSLAEDFAGE